MRTIASIDASAAGADPIGATASVLDANIITLPDFIPGTNTPRSGLALYTTGAAGAVSVEVWALDESDPSRTAAQRIFRLFGAAVSVGQTALVLMKDAANALNIPSGKLYLRVTLGFGAGIRVQAVAV